MYGKNEKDGKKFLLKVQFAESSFSIISRLNNFFNNLFIVWPFPTFIPFEGFQKSVFHCNVITHRLSTFGHVICWHLGYSFVLTFNRFLSILGWNMAFHNCNGLTWRFSEVFLGNKFNFWRKYSFSVKERESMVLNWWIFYFCHFFEHFKILFNFVLFILSAKFANYFSKWRKFSKLSRFSPKKAFFLYSNFSKPLNF
jgi:hypothetical protein